jgi:hypothetical protein
MTPRRAWLADVAYRRRGRMVLAWIGALVVIIGVGSALAGGVQPRLQHAGSESKAASDFTEQRFDGYSGQEVYVVWKDPAGARSPRHERASTRSSPKRSGSITLPSRPRSASQRTGRSERPRCR